jgi:hypothetical protein
MRGPAGPLPFTLALVLVAAGCAAAQSTAGQPTVSPSAQASPAAGDLRLGIDNWTDLTLTLVVNGAVVEDVPPGTQNPVRGQLPPPPWTVEARSPTGRVLASLAVAGPSSENATRVDLQCGRIDIFFGAPVMGPGPGGSLPPCG